LQGQAYFNRPGLFESNQKIAQHFYERALDIDPAFALAHAALSFVQGDIYWLRLDVSPARVASQRRHAAEALRLAPDLPEAHVAMALVHYWTDRDFGRALGEFTIALNGMPNDAGTVAWFGYMNRRLGNQDGAFAAFERATLLDPRSADLCWDLGGETFTLYHHYDRAVAAYDRALDLAPELSYAAIRRGLAYVLWRGDTKPLGEALRNLPENAELGSGGSVAGQRAALLLLERDADGLLRLTADGNGADLVGHVYYLPASLYAAWAHRLRGEVAAARNAFDRAVSRLDVAERELPDDWRVRSARGLALAGAGRHDEALAEARWLQASKVYTGDAHFGAMVAEARAQILAEVGRGEAALDEVERLLRGPSWLSVHTLRMDPRWDPIRTHPRFQELLRKYGS